MTGRFNHPIRQEGFIDAPLDSGRIVLLRWDSLLKNFLRDSQQWAQNQYSRKTLWVLPRFPVALYVQSRDIPLEGTLGNLQWWAQNQNIPKCSAGAHLVSSSTAFPIGGYFSYENAMPSTTVSSRSIRLPFTRPSIVASISLCRSTTWAMGTLRQGERNQEPFRRMRCLNQ